MYYIWLLALVWLLWANAKPPPTDPKKIEEHQAFLEGPEKDSSVNPVDPLAADFRAADSDDEDGPLPVVERVPVSAVRAVSFRSVRDKTNAGPGQRKKADEQKKDQSPKKTEKPKKSEKPQKESQIEPKTVQEGLGKTEQSNGIREEPKNTDETENISPSRRSAIRGSSASPDIKKRVSFKENYNGFRFDKDLSIEEDFGDATKSQKTYEAQVEDCSDESLNSSNDSVSMRSRLRGLLTFGRGRRREGSPPRGRRDVSPPRGRRDASRIKSRLAASAEALRQKNAQNRSDPLQALETTQTALQTAQTVPIDRSVPIETVSTKPISIMPNVPIVPNEAALTENAPKESTTSIPPKVQIEPKTISKEPKIQNVSSVPNTTIVPAGQTSPENETIEREEKKQSPPKEKEQKTEEKEETLPPKATQYRFKRTSLRTMDLSERPVRRALRTDDSSSEDEKQRPKFAEMLKKAPPTGRNSMASSEIWQAMNNSAKGPAQHRLRTSLRANNRESLRSTTASLRVQTRNPSPTDGSPSGLKKRSPSEVNKTGLENVIEEPQKEVPKSPKKIVAEPVKPASPKPARAASVRTNPKSTKTTPPGPKIRASHQAGSSSQEIAGVKSKPVKRIENELDQTTVRHKYPPQSEVTKRQSIRFASPPPSGSTSTVPPPANQPSPRREPSTRRPARAPSNQRPATRTPSIRGPVRVPSMRGPPPSRMSSFRAPSRMSSQRSAHSSASYLSEENQEIAVMAARDAYRRLSQSSHEGVMPVAPDSRRDRHRRKRRKRHRSPSTRGGLNCFKG